MDTSAEDSGPSLGCPLTAALDAIGGKWKLIILWWLQEQPRHFGELRRLMPRITHKVLSEQLRELRNDGLIAREVQDDALRRVRYSLTAHGRSVQPLLEAVREWGRGHAQHLDVTSEERPRAETSSP